jgi:hypothetical protein
MLYELIYVASMYLLYVALIISIVHLRTMLLYKLAKVMPKFSAIFRSLFSFFLNNRWRESKITFIFLDRLNV